MNAEEKKTDFDVHLGIRFTHWTRPFWEGTRNGDLLIMKCKNCGHKMFPPRLYCTSCMSQDTEWVKIEGKGTIYTYSIAYEYPPTRVAKFLSTPYIIARVDLEEEGIRMITTIEDCEPDDVKIGMDVEVKFHDIGEGVILPKFRPVK